MILIIVVEGALRIFEYVTVPCSIYENEAFEQLNYFEKKNICYDTNTLVHGKSPLYLIKPFQEKFTMNINSQGFRGPEISNDEDVIRIFFTGGSTAFGFGSTSDKTTIPGYLQEFFDENYKNLNIQVINAGINGADSYREILYIKEKLINFQPFLIISYTGVNDSGGYMREIIFNQNDVDETNFLKFSDLPWYRTPFVINNLVKNHLNLENNSIKDKVIDFEVSENTFQNNWGESCKLLKNKNIKSAIFIQPALVTKKSPSNFEKEILNEAYQDQKIILERFSKTSTELRKKCDIVEDIRFVLDETTETTYYDSVHMNNLGNKIVAKKIYEKIEPIIKNEFASLN